MWGFAVPDGHELTGFLRRCLSADEHVARKATKHASTEWHVDPDGVTMLWWRPLKNFSGLDPDADRWMGQKIEQAGDVIAPHIARWDPARVLAEVTLRKRLLDAYEAALTRPDTSEEVRRVLEWTLRVLVAGYAGRDGFREEWLLPDHEASESA